MCTIFTIHLSCSEIITSHANDNYHITYYLSLILSILMITNQKKLISSQYHNNTIISNKWNGQS